MSDFSSDLGCKCRGYGLLLLLLLLESGAFCRGNLKQSRVFIWEVDDQNVDDRPNHRHVH